MSKMSEVAAIVMQAYKEANEQYERRLIDRLNQAFGDSPSNASGTVAASGNYSDCSAAKPMPLSFTQLPCGISEVERTVFPSFGRMESTVDDLSGLVMELEKRLTPLLQHQVANEADKTRLVPCDPLGNCEVSARINATADRLRSVNDRIAKMVSLLQV